jgi:hypothetical protein
MSSATSIDRDGPVPAKDDSRAADASFRPSHFFVMAALLLATAAVVVARQTTPSNLVLVSLAVGAAGAAAAALYRTLGPLTTPDVSTFRERPSVRSRAALEREKMLVLRSIKELEFDRAMGKVSAKDFDEMSGRLRARALTLMKQLDDGGTAYRALIERELKARLVAPAPAPTPAAAAVEPAGCPCGTVNDADAAFCKRCGNKLVAS